MGKAQDCLDIAAMKGNSSGGWGKVEFGKCVDREWGGTYAEGAGGQGQKV